MQYRVQAVGPSPRTWGLQRSLRLQLRNPRSIPTHVGFTAYRANSRRTLSGPSPRTWGLPVRQGHEGAPGRSIPTHVGFTPDWVPAVGGKSVHPHARGVYCTSRMRRVVSLGPSPRTWGLLRIEHKGPIAFRSIPTHVGFTARVFQTRIAVPVHPHARGVYEARNLLKS